MDDHLVQSGGWAAEAKGLAATLAGDALALPLAVAGLGALAYSPILAFDRYGGGLSAAAGFFVYGVLALWAAWTMSFTRTLRPQIWVIHAALYAPLVLKAAELMRE